MQKYIVDIDGTICSHEKDYRDALPFRERIDKINKLYDEGNYIVYDTARGTVTGIDWKEVTENQFKEWGVKYHELIISRKPFGDVYIDDRAINATDFFK
jgi:hypothetical protein